MLLCIEQLFFIIITIEPPFYHNEKVECVECNLLTLLGCLIITKLIVHFSSQCRGGGGLIRSTLHTNIHTHFRCSPTCSTFHHHHNTHTHLIMFQCVLQQRRVKKQQGLHFYFVLLLPQGLRLSCAISYNGKVPEKTAAPFVGTLVVIVIKKVYNSACNTESATLV